MTFLKKIGCIQVVSFFSLFIYKLLLDYMYLNQITEYFSEYLFQSDFNAVSYILGIIISLYYIFFMIILININSFSSIIIFIFDVMYFLPGDTVLSLANFNDRYSLFVFLYFSILHLFYFCIKNVPKFKPLKKFNYSVNNKFYYILIFSAFFFIIFISNKYSHVRLFINISEVYKYRLLARTFSIPTIIAYIKAWITALTPFFIVYSIIRKKRLCFLVLLLLEFINYGFDGAKIILFRIPIEIMVGFFITKKNIKFLPVMFFLLVIFSFLEFQFFGFSKICDYILRRMFYLPTQLGHISYVFFSNNEFDYLRSSVLRFFGFSSPYSDLGIPRTLGTVCINRPDCAVDVGLAGDAFSNFGWYSLFIYPILIVFVLKIYDYLFIRVDYRVSAICSIMYAIIFLDTAFFTILLTNALLLLPVLIYLYPIRVSEKKGVLYE